MPEFHLRRRFVDLVGGHELVGDPRRGHLRLLARGRGLSILQGLPDRFGVELRRGLL